MPLMGIFFAVILSLGDYPSEIRPDTEFSVTTTLTCARCGDSYLRAVFFPSDSRYFGFTQNNSGEWIAASAEKTRYFLVTADQISSGTWSGQIRARPDDQASEYTGPGDYSFKLIRYTVSGSKSAETDPVILRILGPTLTPVPPSATRQPPTQIPATATPLGVVSAAVSSTPRPVATARVLGTDSSETQISQAVSVTFAPSPQPPVSEPAPASKDWPAWVFIALSAAGLLVSAFIYLSSGVYTRHS